MSTTKSESQRSEEDQQAQQRIEELKAALEEAIKEVEEHNHKTYHQTPLYMLVKWKGLVL